MDPITIGMLAAQLGPAAMQLIQGINQKQQGDAMAANIKDPIYNIPEAQKESLALARTNASSRYMPGQTNLQNRLDQGTANITSDVLRTSRSSQDALAALMGVNAQNLAGEQEIGFRSAQDFNERQSILRNELAQMAAFQDKKWTNDVLNRFLRDSAAASAMRNAGITNTYQGAKAGFNALGMAAQGGLFGGTKSTAATGGWLASEIPQTSLGSMTPASGSGMGIFTPEQENALLEFIKSGGTNIYNNPFD
jgi:hypothetical protein